MNVDSKINSKIDNLMSERQVIISEMNALSKQYDAYKVRLVEVEGAIRELSDLLEGEETDNDTESDTEQGSDSNEG